MVLLLAACVQRWEEADPTETGTTGDPGTTAPSFQVPLRWVRGHDADTWDSARAGIWWQLANLGAVPPVDEQAVSVLSVDEDEVRFTLDLEAVGFPEAALPAVADAVAFVATTEETALYGGLDLGAFFLRTLYEPWHYYAITGACGQDAAWEAAHLAEDPAAYAVTDSLLVKGDRLDHYTAPPASVAAIAHLVEEGTGSIADGTFEARETESIDVMPNGMLRYAVYDDAGDLAPWGEASPAGQPGRCLWCHEDHLQPGLASNAGAEGYVPAATFVADIAAQTDAVAALRAGLATAVYFDPPDAHEHGELLTETWLLPSPGRLAREWFLDETVVAEALTAAGVPTTTNPEYPSFGDLVTRDDANRVFAALLPGLVADPTHPFYGRPATFTPVATLPSAREPAEAPRVWGDADALGCD